MLDKQILCACNEKYSFGFVLTATAILFGYTRSILRDLREHSSLDFVNFALNM